MYVTLFSQIVLKIFNGSQGISRNVQSCSYLDIFSNKCQGHLHFCNICSIFIQYLPNSISIFLQYVLKCEEGLFKWTRNVKRPKQTIL